MLSQEVQIKMEKTFHSRKEKPQVFQALFLKNDKSQDVEVLEDVQIDFGKIQEHLQNGGSIFITSKSSQKLKLNRPRKSKQQFKNRRNMKTVTAYYIDHL